MKRKQRTIFVAVIVALLLATVGLAAATMIPSAEELLTSSLETLETVTSGHAVIDVIAQLPERDVNGSAEVWGALNVGPNGEPAVRIVVLASSESEFTGLTLVSDGSQFWLYNPDRNSVVVGQHDEMAAILADRMAEYAGQWSHDGAYDAGSADHPENAADAVALLLEYFTVERAGSGQIGDSDADVVRLVPIAEKMPDEIRLAGGFANLWLSVSDQLPLAAEYAESAAGFARVEASQVQINQPIEPDVFTFDIPPGVEVIQAADLLAQMETLKQGSEVDTTQLLTPSVLPEGAQPGETQQFGGAVVQRFDLPGQLSFVIAQGPTLPQEAPAEATNSQTVTVRGVEGKLYTNEDASRSLLIWEEEGAFFMVAGDLSSEQSLAVAESLQ